MIRIYQFAGDDPEALGGTAVRVMGDRVALEVGDDSSAVGELVAITPGGAYVSAADIDEVMPIRIPADIEAAIADVVRDASTANVRALDDRTKSR